MYKLEELNNSKVSELREIAKKLEIKNHEKLKKLDLAYAILDYQAEHNNAEKNKGEAPKKVQEKTNPKKDFVKKLKPKTYKWDKRTWYVSEDATSEDVLNTVPDGSKKKDRINIGFMAQDVLALEQEIGFGNNKNDMLFSILNGDETAYGLKYERLIPLLVNAIKELSEENKDLKSRIEALESN